MTNTIYDWTISAMPAVINEGDLNNVVYEVHWRLKATKEDKEAETYSVVSIPMPTGEDFTPYDQLTKEQVVGWVVSILSVVPEPIDGEEQISELDKIKLQLDADIELQLNPVTEVLPLPWDVETPFETL